MQKAKIYDFFLGGSFGGGFRSLFSYSYDVHDGWRAFIIKGGPGTGKSTLMKKAANEGVKRNMTVERCFCSSDKKSLDAVIFPEIKTVIMDGTAPHVVEPANPGVCESIVDVSSAWDTGTLRKRRTDILELSKRCSACHKAAQNALLVCSVFRNASLQTTDKYIDTDKISNCARRLMSIAGKQEKGIQSKRLLSAVSGGGVHFFSDTIVNNFSTVITVEDRFSRCSELLFGAMNEKVCADNAKAYICFCSQCPDKIEHILFPSSSIAFTSSNRFHSTEPGRVLHASRFMTKAPDAQERRELFENEKKCALMINEAGSFISKAKTYHDELESCYISAVDFDKVNEITDKTISKIFS